MSNITTEVLIESKFLRTETLKKASPADLESVLASAKVHALFLALWKGEGWATTAQVAEYYEVADDTVWQAVKRHKDEFETAGYTTPKRSELPPEALCEFTDKLLVNSEGRLPALFNPRATVLLSMFLRDSLVAKGVRTALLQTAENYSTLSVEINQLREENQQLRFEIGTLTRVLSEMNEKFENAIAKTQIKSRCMFQLPGMKVNQEII